VVLVSTLDAPALEGSGARGFVPQAELSSPRLVELLGPHESLEAIPAGAGPAAARMARP
jgi:hypothetical protein